MPPAGIPEFKVIFVDEAQDLSLIQWAMINKIEMNKHHRYGNKQERNVMNWLRPN